LDAAGLSCKGPTLGTLQAANDDGPARICALEDQHYLAPDVNPMDVLRRARWYGGITALAREDHERNPAIVLKSNQYANGGAIQACLRRTLAV
jgi:hypothetical protein